MERKEALEEGEEEEDIDADDEGKGGKLGRLKHCHCSLFKPTPELLNYMSDGQPYQRYKREQQAKQKERERVEREKGVRREVLGARRAQQL